MARRSYRCKDCSKDCPYYYWDVEKGRFYCRWAHDEMNEIKKIPNKKFKLKRK